MYCKVINYCRKKYGLGELFVCLFVFKTGFLCVTAVLELALADQAGLELIEIQLPLPPSGVLGLRAYATTT